MNLTLPTGKISFKRIILVVIGSFFAFGIFEKSIEKALAEYGFRIYHELLLLSNWGVVSIVFAAAMAGLLVGALIKKRGKFYGALPSLAVMSIFFGVSLYSLYKAGYSFASFFEEWRSTKLVLDWYALTHSIFATCIYGVIAGSIGGHWGEKIAKAYEAEGANEENNLFLFLFAPKARTILTTLLLADCFYYLILSIGIIWIIVKWHIIGVFFFLSHFLALFGAWIAFGILSIFSFPILFIPLFAPFIFQNWWNAQKTNLRKAGIYILFLIGLPIIFYVASSLTYWRVGVAVSTASEKGIPVWEILLDHWSRPNSYFLLSQYYKNNGKEEKSNKYLKMSNDELMRQAEAQLQIEQLSEGIRKLERIIKQDKNHVEAHLSLGIVYLDDIGDNQRAITYFEEALQILPQDPEILYYLGVAYKEEDILKSKQYLQEAIKYGSFDFIYEDIVQNAREILLEYSK